MRATKPLVASATCLFLGSTAAAAPRLVILPDTSGFLLENGPTAYEMSDSGRVVIGLTDRADATSFARWDDGTITASYGRLDGGNGFNVVAGAVSAEGTVIYGNSITTREAVSVADDGSLSTITSGSSGFFSLRDVTPDGALAVGYTADAGDNQLGTFDGQTLAQLGRPAGSDIAAGVGISDDGGRIAGIATAGGPIGSFLYQQGDFVSLANLPAEADLVATAISGDGSTVVGGTRASSFASDGSAQGLPFIWTDAGGTRQLGDVNGVAREVDLDGDTIVGQVLGGDAGTTGVVWLDGEAVDFDTLLAGAGLSVEGRLTTNVMDVTPDGLTFLAVAGSASGADPVLFVATVPEPTSLTALGLAGVMLRRRR